MRLVGLRLVVSCWHWVWCGRKGEVQFTLVLLHLRKCVDRQAHFPCSSRNVIHFMHVAALLCTSAGLILREEARTCRQGIQHLLLDSVSFWWGAQRVQFFKESPSDWAIQHTPQHHSTTAAHQLHLAYSDLAIQYLIYLSSMHLLLDCITQLTRNKHDEGSSRILISVSAITLRYWSGQVRKQKSNHTMQQHTNFTFIFTIMIGQYPRGYIHFTKVHNIIETL